MTSVSIRPICLALALLTPTASYRVTNHSLGPTVSPSVKIIKDALKTATIVSISLFDFFLTFCANAVELAVWTWPRWEMFKPTGGPKQIPPASSARKRSVIGARL